MSDTTDRNPVCESCGKTFSGHSLDELQECMDKLNASGKKVIYINSDTVERRR